MSAGAEAGDLLESLGVAAADASAVEKKLWVQVQRAGCKGLHLKSSKPLWSTAGVCKRAQVQEADGAPDAADAGQDDAGESPARLQQQRLPACGISARL
jgi:hypothetical protein